MDSLTNEFKDGLANLLNLHGVDAEVGMPDFILSDYLLGQIKVLLKTCKWEDDYNGKYAGGI